MTATAQTLALQRYDITEKNVMHSNSETMSHLELVVHTLSDRCQELIYFPQLLNRNNHTEDERVGWHHQLNGRESE